MGKTLGTIAKIAVGVGLVVFAPQVTAALLVASGTTVAAAATVTAITSAIMGIGASLALSTASTALFGPKAPKTQLTRLNVSLDPITPRKAVFGTTAMPLDLRYHEASGTNQEFIDYIIAVAAHKVTAISEIWFEEKQAWTASGGVTATYNGFLTVTTRTEGTSANTIAINGGGKWGSSRRLTGCAYVHLRIKRTGATSKTQSPLVNGLPSRVTIIGNGALLYDPRKDSTVAGGSGTHRAADQTTWGAYTDADDCDNPALQLLWWLLGWKINGKLSIGCGVPANRIDIASFITAANICDENVTLAIGGTQKRYRTSGTASDSDNRMDIINTFLTSMNGTLRDNGGKLTLSLMKNDLASYSLDLSENDMLGEFEWQQTRGLTESYNVVRGRYVDPSVNSLYQPVDYPEVSIASADGIERATTLDLMYVEDGRRAQRIAKQVLQRNQYRGMFSATFNTKALGCQVGDVVRLTVSSLGWTNKLFRVVSQEIRFDGQVPLALVEENAAIYAWSNEDQAPVVPTSPTIYNPLNDPFILGLVDAQAIADGKIDSYYQTEPPSGATEGDYWTDTNDSNKLYRYTSGAWVSIQDGGIPAAISAAAGAQATANGKVTTYYSETTPTATAIGDLWYKPSTGFVQRWNGSAWADVATLGATIGENVKDKSGNPVAIEAIRNNLALIDWWKKGATIPWGQNGEYNVILSSSADMAGNPPPPIRGHDDLWFCQEVTGDSEAGGGWGGAPIAPLDPDKAYRFVLPIFNRNGNGGAYWGTGAVADLNTTTLQVNPYFAVATLPNYDRWYLFVGFIFPRNSTGKTNSSAGVWDCKTGTKVFDGLNFCFLPNGAQPTHRAYQFYASNGSQKVFGRPLIEPIESMTDITLYFEEAARLNNAIGVNGSGQFVNPVGTGNNTVVANNQITVDGSGQLAGIGTGNNTVVANNQINITSGNLNGIGTGSGTEIENSRLDLAFDTSGTAGRARAQLRRNGGATVNNTVQLPSVLQNKDITISSGAISGIGTGDGAVIGNDQIQIDANGNFINAVGAGNGTSIANSLVANRLISRGSVATIIEGNTIRRSSGNSDYNAFVSGDPVSGACFAEAVIAGGGYTMVAFDTAAGSGYYGDQDFVVHASPSAGTAVYRNGTYIGSIGSVTAGHLLRIVYDGERFQVFVNGVQVGPDYAAPAGQTLFPIFNAYNGPGSYTGLNYGPYAINSAETRFIVQTSSGPTLRLIGSNAVIRDAAGSWDSQCYSERGYEGGAYCSFTPTDSSCYFMAGLNSDPTTNASYLSIDYALYMAGDANIYIYESGNGVGTFGTWTAGTVLSVVYDNEYVRYLINGEEVRCVRATAGRKFHFDSSVVQGAAITNLRFGPVTPDASNVDFIHDNNQQSQRGNSVYKNKNANLDWDTKSVSRQVQTGTAFVSGKLSTVNTFLGLKLSSDANPSYTAMQASFHRSANGNWYTWSYSGSRINMGSAYLGVTFDDNTEFRITYDGVKLRWYANNTLLDEAASSPNLTYAACVAIYGRGDRVDNIQFGPYTDNAWVSVGGTGRPENYATSSENLIVNGLMSNGAANWQLSSGVTVATHGLGNGAPFSLRLPSNASTYNYPNDGALIPINGATNFFCSGWSYKASGDVAYIGVEWFYADDTPAAGTSWQAIPSTGSWTSFALQFAPPASAAKCRMLVHGNNSTGDVYVGNIRFARTESGATVGATAGTNLRRSNATVLGDNDIITSLGTAANIAGQAATATSSDFSAVTGTTKPENNATVGATAGTNLRRSNATVLGDNDIITSLGTAANINNQGALATRSNARLGNEVVDESGNAIAAEFIRNNVDRGSLGTIAYPSGGSFAAEVNGLTGAVQIMLPNAIGDGRYTMLKFQVDIYNYTTDATITYDVSGYVYPANPSWVNCTAKAIGGGAGSVKPVRFGRTGSGASDKFCIWIGDVSTVWYYPKVQVRNLMTGYSSIDVAFWQSGWAVSTVTTLGAVDYSVLNPTASDAVFGVNALEEWNGAVATLPNFKTIQGTAAAISGQAATATSSDFASVTGATKPEGNATNDRYVDRRNTNEAPNWYLSNYNVRTAYEFKDAFALGVPGNPGSAGFYGALVTTNDYADFSGGAIKQRFTYGSGVTAGTSYVRTGSGTTWGAWTKDFNGFLRPTFDTSDLLETGSTVATVANFKTSQGTAAAITSQGALATKSSVGNTDIADSAVTPEKINVSSLSAIAANVGTLTAGIIRNTSDTYRVDVTNGRSIVQTGGYMKVTGAPFGSSNQFIEWYGPYFANLASCTEANAIYFLRTNGSAYFGGSLSAGILRNAIQTSSLSGPVLNVETGTFGSNGGSISIILNYYAYSEQTSPYPATQQGLINWNAAVSAWGATSSGGFVDATKSVSGSATIALNRSIGGSAFSTVTALSISGGTERINGFAPTPGDAPGSLNFQRTFQGSLTYADPTLSTANRNYQASLTGRDGNILIYPTNQQQRMGIQTTE